MKRLVLTALAVFTTTAALAQGAPVHTGWLADGADLLTSDEAAAIRAEIGSVQSASGITVGVLTLAHADQDPKTIAVATLNAWNPGPKSALLLVIVQPRKLYLQPGTAFAGTFDENAATTLLKNDVVPYMKAKKTFEAIKSGIQSVRLKLTPPESTPTPVPTQPAVAVTQPAQDQPATWGSWLFGGFIAAIVFIGTAAYGSGKQNQPALEDPFTIPRFAAADAPAPPPASPAYPSATSPTYAPPPKPKKRSRGWGYVSPRTSDPTPNYESSYESPSYDSGSSSSSYDSGSSSSSYDPPASYDSGGGASSCDGGGGGGADY